MTILIDLTCLSFHLSGVERYALCISEELLKMDTENKYILVFRNEVYPSFVKFIDNERVRSVVLHGEKKQVFLLFRLPKALNRIKADCYLFLASKSPVLFRGKKIYNTIHDLVAWDYPQTMRSLQKVNSKVLNRNASIVSERIFTVSEFSKGRIHSILHYPKEKILVAYSAVSNSLSSENKHPFEEVKAKYALPDKYIMNLSTLEPRKNLELLLRCYDQVADEVDYDVVLIGRKGWKIDEMLESIKANRRVHVTGFVDDEDVVSIYQHAMCFVFPSVYEGFGLPPIEALSLGTPVLSSDAASLPEVLRDQADYFENNDEEALCKKLRELDGRVDSMPHTLDSFQRERFSFQKSASIILAAMTNA